VYSDGYSRLADKTKHTRDITYKGDRPPLPIGSFLAQNLQMNYTTHKLNADMPTDAGTMALHGRSNRESMNIKQVPLVLFSKLFRVMALGLDSLQGSRVSS
jgi:hypothetical protein